MSTEFRKNLLPGMDSNHVNLTGPFEARTLLILQSLRCHQKRQKPVSLAQKVYENFRPAPNRKAFGPDRPAPSRVVALHAPPGKLRALSKSAGNFPPLLRWTTIPPPPGSGRLHPYRWRTSRAGSESSIGLTPANELPHTSIRPRWSGSDHPAMQGRSRILLGAARHGQAPLAIYNMNTRPHEHT